MDKEKFLDTANIEKDPLFKKVVALKLEIKRLEKENEELKHMVETQNAVIEMNNRLFHKILDIPGGSELQ